MFDSLKLIALISLTSSLWIQFGLTLNNGLALTPPMGWIPWERFTCTVDCVSYPNDCLNEQLFKQIADKMASDGYAEAGYKYVNLDDCWSELERNKTSGQLMVNKLRFPNGLNDLSFYMFRRNLMLGIYGDCGTKTCNNYPAQLKDEQNLEDNYFDLDAEQFKRWQINSFKFDGCNLGADKQELICPKMSKSLGKVMRPILFNCEYPFYMLRNQLQPNWTLVAESCNTWRYYEDIEDSWQSVLNVIDYTINMQTTIAFHHNKGQWFDPDQLIIGNYALSLDQARAQMALWCLWSAPLYMSADLRSIAPEMGAILKNKNLIQVDQDPLGLFGLMVGEQEGGQLQAFVKIVEPIQNDCPSYVIVYLNRATLGNSRIVSFNLRNLLIRMPLNMAAKRQKLQINHGRQIDSKQIFDVDKCKQLIKNGMTRKRTPTPPPGLLVLPANKTFNQAKEIPVEERRVGFKIQDLFDDQLESSTINLDENLELRVNPSGVRMVKLTIDRII